MFYNILNTSKQAIHFKLNRLLKEQEEQTYLYDIVLEIRGDHPTLSCRAMYHKIMPQMLGRDAFEDLCKTWGFASSRPINYCRTTNSYGVTRFDNLLVDNKITAINQAFVSDITYFELDRFYYITFILDAHSRYILGYSLSDRLTTEKTTLPAFKMMLKNRQNNLPEGIIFHSDGGGQYYDKEFLKLTPKYGFRNSMCKEAYENGKAERINGTIKNNYLKHKTIENYAQLVKELDRSVSLYNNERPHKSLNYKTPLYVEKEALILTQQTRPMMKESLEANTDFKGHRAP